MPHETASERLRKFNRWAFTLDLSEDEARAATARRSAQVEALSRCGVGVSAGGSKLHYRDLSPGCQSCAEGTWSCLFINALCTADCYFCPQPRDATTESTSAAEGLEVEDAGRYVHYLEQFGFRGVGFSGGEPLLALDTLAQLIRRIKRHFGDAMYVWMYTNGDLLDAASATRLTDAGLDEIRFNLSASGYDMDRVERACRVMRTVTVEIPAIPEDGERVKHCLREMHAMGVRHLNLHQLSATRDNHEALAARGYAFVPSFLHEPVVLESEPTALDLVQYAADHHLQTGVHYCSRIYKVRYQGLAGRTRAARHAVSEGERVTAAGYIATESDNVLRYHEAELVGRTSLGESAVEDVRALPSDPDGEWLVVRRCVVEVDARDTVARAQLGRFERLDTGLPEILSSKTLWERQLALARRLAG
jgi:pyruvate formate-lyase activating enzyme-like uncharacterized protein